MAVALSDSLDRNGRGGMLAPFRFADGTNLLPGASWTNETTTGLYRFDGGDLRLGVLTQDVMRWQTTGVQIWDNGNSQWNNVLTDGGSGSQVPVNIGTADGQTLYWGETTDKVWKATDALTVAPDTSQTVLVKSGTENTASIGWWSEGAVADTGRWAARVGPTSFTIQTQDDAGAGSTAYQILRQDGSNTPSAHRWTTGTVERMSIDSNGRVGIGRGDGLESLLTVWPLGNVYDIPDMGSMATFVDAGSGTIQNVVTIATRGNGGVGRGAALVFDGAAQSSSVSVARIVGLNESTTTPYTQNSIAFEIATGDGVFDEKVRIDTNGNVGIGTDSPQAPLMVGPGIGNNPAAPSAPDMVVTSASDSVGITIYGSATAKPTLSFGEDGYTSQSAWIQHDNNDRSLNFRVAAAERMRIDSSGNVGIGTTNPTTVLTVQPAGTANAEAIQYWRAIGDATNNHTLETYYNGTASTYEGTPPAGFAFAAGPKGGFGPTGGLNLGTRANGGPLIFSPTGVERMRIDSTGNVGIGITAPEAPLHVKNADAQLIVQATSTSGAGHVAALRLGPSLGDGAFRPYWAVQSKNNSLEFTFESTGTAIARFGTSPLGTGPVYTSGGTFTSTNPSDLHLKKDIVPVPYGLDAVMALSPVSFMWKEGDDPNKHMGFIAQDVEGVIPEIFQLNKVEGEDDWCGLRSDELVPVLVKAIQELTARVEQLES